jgi:hypothetical protein
MFSRRFFKRQYFIAISLFSNIERAREAVIDYHRRNVHPTYAIIWQPEHKLLGWAFVAPFASACTYWNEQMRDKSLTFSTWQDGRLFEWWNGRPPPDRKTLNDVQLTVVYETLEKYERQSANAGWQMLLEGHPAYVEWYDASPDKRWTTLFRPR